VVDTLENFRKANPELRDWSDAELASALYKKYGQGMDEFDFALELKGKGKRATPFEAGTAGLKSAAQTGIAALQSQLGYEEAAKENLKEAQQRQEDIAQRYRREVPTAADIGMSPSRLARYAYEVGAESVPYALPSVIGGIGGGIIGGPIGAAAGASALSFPVFTATNIQRQVQEGTPLQDVSIGKAAATAVPQAAFDALIGRYIPFIGKAGTGSLIRRSAMKAVEGGAVESLTETAQQALEVLQANPEKLMDFSPEVRQELVESAVAGGLLGGGLGAVTGAVSRQPQVEPTTPTEPTEPTAAQPTAAQPTEPGAAVEPTVTPPGEPVAVPAQGNEWLQQNAKPLEAFNEAPMEYQVVEPATKLAPPKKGEVRMYFDPNVTEGNTGATAFFANPKDLLKAKPEAAIKFVDVPETFNFAKSEPTAVTSYVTDPAVDKDLLDKGQDYVLDEGKKLPVKFTSIVDKSLYAIAKKTNPDEFNLAKDYLSKGLGLSEDEIDLKSRDVSAQIDKYLEDRKQSFGKKQGAEESITVPRFSEEPSVATFPVEPRETIGGIDVNTTDPAEQQKLKDIIDKSPFNVTDASNKALESYAPGIVDLARDIHLKFFPGIKMNLRSGKGKTGGNRLFGSMNYGKLLQGEITINVNTDAAYSPESALRTLFHEFAHVFEFTWFSSIPKDQLRAIIDQYVRETYPDAMRRMAAYEIFKVIEQQKLKSSADETQIAEALKGKVEKTPKGKIVLKGAAKAEFDPKYHLGFSEWIAEKGANWYMNSDRVPRTALQKAFKNFYDGLRKIYYEISKYLGITPNQGAFEQLLSELYGRKETTPIDTAGKYVQTEIEAEAAARAAGVPLGAKVTEGRRRKGLIEDVMREAAVQEEARPGYTSMGDRVISKDNPLTQADIQETDNNPALLDPNIPPEVQKMAYFVAAKKPVGFWSNLLSNLFGRVGNESLASAFIRNNVASQVPFLERADLREVGRTLERMQNAQGRITGLIESGHLVYDPKTKQLEFRSKIGDRDVGGLKKLFAPAGIKGEAALQLYMIAKRELDLRARGRTGIGYKDPSTGTIDPKTGKIDPNTMKPFTNEQLKKIVEATPEHIKKVGQDLYEFNKEMVQFSVDTGVIPQELGDNLMSMFYTPFYRIQDTEIENNGNLTIAGPVGAALKNPSAVTLFNQKVTAGGQIDANFYENTFRNYSSIVTAGLKNIAYSNAAKALINLKDPSIAQVVGKPDKNSITYRVAGGDKHLQINDPAMFQALAAFSPKQLDGFVSAASKFANVLRTGVTTAPPFQIANLYRGVLDVYLKTGMPLTDLVVGTYKGIKEAYKRGASAQAIQAQTGFGGFRYGASAQSQAEALRAAFATKEGSATAWQQGMNLLGKLETIGDASEMGPRIAYYKWLVEKKKMSPEEAAWEAVNLTNFSRSGTGKGITGSALAVLIPMIPFLNARVQSLYRLMEAGTAGGGKTLFQKGSIGLPLAIVNRGLMLAAIELGLNLIYGDDDWYKNLSVRDKIANNYIAAGDTVIALPRVFELGSAFGAIPALVLDAIRQQDGSELADGLGQIALGTFFFNPIPQFAKPIVELYFNKDMFTGRDIETLSDKRLPSGERADELTSEVAKLIGKFTGEANLSPKQVDVLLRGYLGTLATTFTSVVDGFLASAGTRPQGYFGDPTDFTSIGANTVGLARFVKSPEQLSNKYVKDFYEMVKDVTEITSSIKKAQDTGDIDALQAKLEANPQAMTLKPMLNRIQNRIGDLNDAMDKIRLNKNISSEDKVQRINVLREEKVRLAEEAVKIGRELGL
jgi:hypothetical protein